MALKTAVTGQDDVFVLDLQGRLDAVTSGEFQKLLLEKIEQTKGDLTLDCEGLDFVSSAGLRIFLTGQKALQAKGFQLRLIHVNESIMKVLVMTGFDKFLTIER